MEDYKNILLGLHLSDFVYWFIQEETESFLVDFQSWRRILEITQNDLNE